MLADGWPLVPTNEGRVLPLSRAEAVVSADALPSDIRALLKHVGTPTLLDGLFHVAVGSGGSGDASRQQQAAAARRWRRTSSGRTSSSRRARGFSRR